MKKIIIFLLLGLLLTMVLVQAPAQRGNTFSCQTQRCQEIDEVWQKVSGKLNLVNKEKVWHGNWVDKSVAYPAPGSAGAVAANPDLMQNGWLFQTPPIKTQSGDASRDLTNLLTCMRGKLPANAGQISSISDSKGLAFCRDTWNDPNCAHVSGSAHYGCGIPNALSMAVDYGDEENTCVIVQAARDCGVPKNKIFGPIKSGPWDSCKSKYTPLTDHDNHVHVTVPEARCS
jgi:hypothetical protein